MRIKVLAASLVLSALACAHTPAQQPDNITVNVLGAVNKPSRYVLPRGATVLDALASAGDVTKEGDRKHVKLIHASTAGKPDVAIINVRAMLDGTVAAGGLQDGDTIVISARVYDFQY